MQKLGFLKKSHSPTADKFLKIGDFPLLHKKFSSPMVDTPWADNFQFPNLLIYSLNLILLPFSAIIIFGGFAL